MIGLNYEKLEAYLTSLYGEKVRLKQVKQLAGQRLTSDMKGFGYGIPIQLEFEIKGKKREVVMETMKGDEFGHEFPYDRAYNMLLAHATYNNLSKHVSLSDVGIITSDGNVKSIRNYNEFFILMNMEYGTEYYQDLETIGKKEYIHKADIERCLALAEYIANIHSEKHNYPSLYMRRIRELLGHGECIMGLVDSYPSDFELGIDILKMVEEKCLEWRWRIKGKSHRLSRVHGDFHPWNVMFRGSTNFTVLDRSRGEWGEPADDIAAMSINYIFFSLQSYGRLEGSFTELFSTFLNEYLKRTGDYEILKVIQPFYAWRGLVIASPIWYPNLDTEVRRKIFNFILHVLDTETFNFKDVNSYLTSFF